MHTMVKTAYALAIKEIGDSLDGYCVEAVAIMWKFLRSKRIEAVAVRRNMGKGEGHWTIQVNGIEYDPTYNWWSGGKDLYVVGKGSPHLNWKITGTSVTSLQVRDFMDHAW